MCSHRAEYLSPSLPAGKKELVCSLSASGFVELTGSKQDVSLLQETITNLPLTTGLSLGEGERIGGVEGW